MSANQLERDFWSVVVYSMKTKGFVAGAGSVDIYFAPAAPSGQESNWVQTGEDLFLIFPLYGPEPRCLRRHGDCQR